MKKICIYITFVLMFLFVPFHIHAIEVKSYLITDEQEFFGTPHLNTVYFHKSLQVPYKSGKVVLSANPNGTGETAVGEELNVQIGFPGTESFTYKIKSCSRPHAKIPPLDITHLMNKFGPSNLTIRFIQRNCPDFYTENRNTVQYMKIGPMYVVHFDDYEPTTEPFLDLPWNYTTKGLSFVDAATKMSSYFDHEYPLLSASWFVQEPDIYKNSLTNYKGTNGQFAYSGHDGYDYAFESRALLNDPVLSAASGIATFHNNCGACGNAIHIDHGNGYQTRYYHLQPEGLVTSNPYQKITVTDRQQIGKVGFSGNVRPQGHDGAHIHFMLIQDKNGDGNFDDNIPDGLVDPYGWQGSNIDPWTQFTFTQNGETKTGTKSTYLWKHSLHDVKKTLTPEGGQFSSDRFTFAFPKNAIQNDLIFSLKPIPYADPSAELQPIGSVIDATADDGFGNIIAQFNKLFTISMKILLTDYSRYIPESLSIYSSSDGVNWQKEDTIVDLTNRNATTQVNHLTQFAFMGIKKDITPPQTQLVINNEHINSTTPIYYEPVSISFVTSDEPTEESLGVDYTLYKINQQDLQQYAEPFEITDVGEYQIEYYSIDKDGNKEEVKTSTFTIEVEQAQQPQFQIHYDKNVNQFVIEGVNTEDIVNHSQIQKKKQTIDKYQIQNGEYSTTLLTKSPDKNEKDIIKLHSLQYNNESETVLTKYRLLAFNKQTKKNVEKFIQVFQHGDEERIRLTYNENKDITTVVTKFQGNVMNKTSVNGFKKLILTTQNNTLHYSIQ